MTSREIEWRRPPGRRMDVRRQEALEVSRAAPCLAVRHWCEHRRGSW